MPFMLFDELPADKKIVAVVSSGLVENFFDCATDKWELVGEVEGSALESLAEDYFDDSERRKIKSKIYWRDILHGDNR